MVLLAGARALSCPLHPNWFYQEKLENKIKNQISLKAPPSPRSICQGLLAKAPPPWEASDSEGEGVLGRATLTPAPNNMVLALCCITMDAQFPWKGFIFFLATCPCRSPFAFPEVIFQTYLLQFHFWLSAIHTFLSLTLTLDLFYTKGSLTWTLTMVEFKFALCCSSEYILLFPGLMSILF